MDSERMLLNEPCIKYFLRDVSSQDGACIKGCIHACMQVLHRGDSESNGVCVCLTMQYLDGD